jgi:hypothetical protein
VNVYTPKLSAVLIALAVPLSATVAPLPPAVGLIVPETVKVCAVSVKFTPVTLLPLIAVLWLLGVNVKPVRLGATVYVPFGSPVNV